MNPTSLSDPWDDYIEMISLKPVNRLQWMNPMVLCAFWADYIDMIAFKPVKNYEGRT